MKYFTLNELTATNRKIQNYPNAVQIQNLQKLVKNILDPLREMYGKPIKINSGFRSIALNSAVGGAKNSDHLFGYAADITTGTKSENEKLFNLIKDNLKFRQLINEYNFSWVHVSFNENDLKQQILKVK